MIHMQHKLGSLLACAYHIQQFKSPHWNANFKFEIESLAAGGSWGGPGQGCNALMRLLTVRIGFCSQKGEHGERGPNLAEEDLSIQIYSNLLRSKGKYL